MSFQWVIDNAETLSINRKKMVSSTTSRSGIVRAVSRGTQPHKITVQVPDGIAWTTLKANIEAAEALDKFTNATINIPYAKFPWYYGNSDPGASAYSKTVKCVEFPEWTLMARNQVSWSGPFVFIEVIA